MFSDRFSGIRGQRRACKGENREGERGGEWRDGGARFGDGRGNGEWKEERGMMAEVHLRQRDASGGWKTDGHQGCSNQGKKLTGAEIRSTH